MCLRPLYIHSQGIFVPCGKCFECRVRRSIEWSYRIVMESRLHEKNCMVTLTYNDENLPEDSSLYYRHFQLFMKSFRKAIAPQKVRFFMSGEYGERRSRPHYHVILFGYDFPDRYFFRYDNKKTPLFRSPFLESLWEYGFSSIVDVTPEVAKYVANYLQKPPKGRKKRPFVQMSRRPGIAAEAFDDESLTTDKLYFARPHKHDNGNKHPNSKNRKSDNQIPRIRQLKIHKHLIKKP